MLLIAAQSMSFWAQFAPDETTYYPLASDERVYWRIKSPSFADERNLASWLSKERRTAADIVSYELALTFLETTFPHPLSPTSDRQADGFVPGLKKGSSFEEVIAYLDTVPTRVVDDMWKKLSEVAPHWGPNFR